MQANRNGCGIRAKPYEQKAYLQGLSWRAGMPWDDASNSFSSEFGGQAIVVPGVTGRLKHGIPMTKTSSTCARKAKSNCYLSEPSNFILLPAEIQKDLEL